MEAVIKLEKCEVCDDNKAKYTCPKCEVRTCCLTCVDIHKKELNCDGIRDKTKFVPLNKFTDLDLQSDYRLLEELGRSVDQLQRDDSKKFSSANNLPVRLFKLKQAAVQSGVKFEFLPHSFSRHKENTSYYNWKSKELFWKIDWIFPQAENIKWSTKKALDTTRLSELIENVLDPLNTPADTEDCDESATRQILSDKLQFYRAAGLSGVEILLKAEKIKKSNSRFYKLDLTSSLRDNLSNKTIIEFPTLYVIFKDHVDMYEIVDSDDEDEKELTEKPQSRGNKHKKRQQDNKNNKRPKNYLFYHDSSDSEADNGNKEGHFGLSNIPNYDEFVRM
ncbi:box C/D snoRNA protein 1 [Microplitis mediator]|uniref:box C/D snoRNA protein 1 n=1 Tax=Microplitis mediator TaxID=375433 RepID=UPI0025577F30|nr:box C/D snoRNA protein 1 [Microplitis mediator]